MTNKETADIVQKIFDRLDKHGDTLITLVTKMEARDKLLFGNGQPGLLDRMQKEIDAVDKKVGDVKSKVLVVGSTGAGAGAIIGFLAKFIVGKFGH